VTAPAPAQLPPALLWPLAGWDAAAHALARAAGVAYPAAPEWFKLSHVELASGARLAHEAPALYRVDGEPGGLLAIVAADGASLRVLASDGATRTVPAAEVARALVARAEAPHAPAVARVVARAKLPEARARDVHDALVGAALGNEPVAQGWRVRPAAPSLLAALRGAGVPRRLGLTALAYAAQLALLVAAWWMVGAPAAGARGASAGVPAWLGVLGLFVAAHFASSWSAGRLAVDVGRLLRARLMDGLLGLDAEPLRAEGAGQLLGRVMDTEAVESLALGGGLLAVAGVFELATGAVILTLGARGPVQLGLLALGLAAAGVLAARFWRALARWSARRIALTHDLVERMVGHRTLVAQQPPELRHREEDRALDEYETSARALDRAAAALAVLVPRGWLLVGVLSLASVVIAPVGAAALATSLGGVMLAYTALRKLTQALPALATAAVAWRQVAPLFAGAGAAAEPSPTAAAPSPVAPGASPVVIAARGLGFRYPGRPRPALADCSLEIRRGDRVLLQGPSGGGKSTLATLLAGLRAPDEGALALAGVDQSALGLPRWRERVGVVPQFHENHVFMQTFAFNLLLGRGWPPRREDLVEAESICRDLDLGPVLARMPSGLQQVVGESGWQLSHGERSRLFIARALLQKLDVRVLDESFAALDPETLERVLGCVLARAETLVVIAHP
jgi:ATP-binding cassette subfamily B protein